jgi:hypothetical protein
MDIKIVRQLNTSRGICELLLQVDEEYLDLYRKETGEEDFNQESFDQWITQRMENSPESEDWK